MLRRFFENYTPIRWIFLPLVSSSAALQYPLLKNDLWCNLKKWEGKQKGGPNLWNTLYVFRFMELCIFCTWWYLCLRQRVGRLPFLSIMGVYITLCVNKCGQLWYDLMLFLVDYCSSYAMKFRSDIHVYIQIYSKPS